MQLAMKASRSPRPELRGGRTYSIWAKQKSTIHCGAAKAGLLNTIKPIKAIQAGLMIVSSSIYISRTVDTPHKQFFRIRP